MTDHPYGVFTPAEYQAIVRRDADALLDTLAAVKPDAKVPTCPGWTVRDLVEHLGRVHQWASRNVTGGLGSSADIKQTTGPAGEDLASWYARSVDDLLKVLATTDPDAPCWTFQRGNRVAGFWSRRQSHELAMHRTDLLVTAGQPHYYDAPHAADGIGEVLDVFVDRRQTYSVPPLDVAAPVLLECSDRPERWLLAPLPGDRESHAASGPAEVDPAAAAAVIRGPAAGMLLAMWKRQDTAAAALTIEGDAGLATRLLASQLTP
jgi:uncharacterized protein (TIGR03083 family)